MDKPSMPVKLWSAGFAYLLAVGTISAISFGMIGPLIPGYALSLGATLSSAGIVAGIFSFSALVGRPFASAIGDRYNKKYILIIFMFLNGFATVLYTVAPNITWLLPVRILHGLIFAVSGTMNFALGAEFIPRERLAEGIGFIGITMIVGMAIGPNIGIYILEHYSYHLCFMVSGGGIMLASLVLAALKYKHIPRPKRTDGGVALRLNDLIAFELLPNALFAALLSIGTGLASSYLVIFGSERGIANIGLYFVVHAAVVIVTRPMIGRMTDRKGAKFAILPGYILAGAAMIVISMSYSLPPLLFAAVLFAIGAGGAFPAIQTDCLKRLDITRRTVATGTYLIGFDIGMTAGQTLGGVVSDIFDFRTAYAGAGVLMLMGFVCYFLYSKNQENKNRLLSKSI